MCTRVLVTGGSGFMGTNLVQDLVDDHIEVLNLDCVGPLNPDHEKYWKNVDLLKAGDVMSCFNSFRPDCVVHLAARTDLDRGTTLDDYGANTAGTKHVLDAVEAVGTVKRLLVTSSMLVCRLGYIPQNETDYAPTTMYGESKVITEQITRERDVDTAWALIRPTTIWGPWHMRLKNEFLRVLAKGYYFHPGRSCLRTYGYIGNSVHQMRQLLAAPKDRIHRKTFYIGDPPLDLTDYVNGFSKALTGRQTRVVPYPILKAAAFFGDLLAVVGIKRVPLTSYRLSNMTQDNVLDVGPTLDVTGPNPYTLEEGVDKTVHWLRSMEQGS